ncbi:MAG: hypothetical protein NUW37_07635 [Planctomycetes bacterium]|nr:hypothetical protein [Planctomycetota bacterium]
MRHKRSKHFNKCFDRLPADVQTLAKSKFKQFQKDQTHPSIQFKKVGKLWSVRISDSYRALAVEGKKYYLWFWIGTDHDEYERLIDEIK